MARTFSGGVRIDGRKAGTSKQPITEIQAPESLVVHLSQHTGAPARPAVKPGAEVQVGTVVGQADGELSVPVHSPVSGKVRWIGEFLHPGRGMSTAVAIDNDGEDRRIEAEEWKDLSDGSPDEIRNAIRNCGVVGLGGAAFPTHAKLEPRGKKIDVFILNGVECEPYLTGDDRLMLEHPAEIVEGLRIMMRVVGAERGLVAVGEDKPVAAARLEEKTRGERELGVVRLEARYPLGSEKQLIKTVTGREVPRGGLPADVGCLVQNVGTSLAVLEAVKYGRPLVARVLTVGGSGARGAGNLRVRIGTYFKHVIAQLGGATENCRRVLAGGPMTGTAQHTTEVPVIKCTTGVILLAAGEVFEGERGPCIRCGRCVKGCPMRLMPNDLGRFVERGMTGRARSYGVLDCIECGVCAFVCPSKIPLVELMRRGKAWFCEPGEQPE